MELPPQKNGSPALSKDDFEHLAHFRYQLRRFLRFSEEVTHRRGITALQYQLMLQIKGFPGRDWATVGELAERLQAKPHGVVSLVTRCESAGLVQRRASDSDKRRVEVKLTARGVRCLKSLARQHRTELLSPQGLRATPALQMPGHGAQGSTTPVPYRGLMEQAPDALIYADREGIIRFWNQAAQNLLGFTAEEALGQSLDLIIPERFRNAHWVGFNRAMASGEARLGGRVLTTRCLHRDGSSRYVDLSFGLLKDDSGQVQGALAVGRERAAPAPSRKEAGDAAS